MKKKPIAGTTQETTNDSTKSTTKDTTDNTTNDDNTTDDLASAPIVSRIDHTKVATGMEWMGNCMETKVI